MVFSKASHIPTCNIHVHGKIQEQVNLCVCFGSQFTSDARCEKEIRRRIGIAKFAFTSMSKLLTSRDIHMTVRIKVMGCYVWSTLLYGCETWTIYVAKQKKKLVAFEIWLYRCISYYHCDYKYNCISRIQYSRAYVIMFGCGHSPRPLAPDSD